MHPVEFRTDSRLIVLSGARDESGDKPIARFYVFDGQLLQWRITVPGLSSRRMRALLMALRLLAMAGMAVVYIGLPVIRLIDGMQPPPPPCAHDEAGRQLTVCLKPYDPTGDATR